MMDTPVMFQNIGDSALKAQIDIKAPPEKVYAAWTRQEQFLQWFGPRSDGKLEVDRFDCSVGGSYDVTMVFSDGDRARLTGTYQELDPPKRIVFTWQVAGDMAAPGEMLVTVDLLPSQAGTHLTLTHERFATTALRDQHHSGWEPLLQRLAVMLAG